MDFFCDTVSGKCDHNLEVDIGFRVVTLMTQCLKMTTMLEASPTTKSGFFL